MASLSGVGVVMICSGMMDVFSDQNWYKIQRERCQEIRKLLAYANIWEVAGRKSGDIENHD